MTSPGRPVCEKCDAPCAARHVLAHSRDAVCRGCAAETVRWWREFAAARGFAPKFPADILAFVAPELPAAA